MQQVGGGAEVLQRVHVAPALDPATTLLAGPTSLPLGPVAPPSARRRLKARRRPYGRKLGFAVFTTLSGALAFMLLTDGGRQTRGIAPLLPDPDQVLSWTGLRIDQVALSGQRFASDTDIFDALDLPNAHSLLSFDSTAARERIERLPWVATARIARIFPGTLDVHVSERKPAALWLRGGHEYLIDAEGRTLSQAQARSRAGLAARVGRGRRRRKPRRSSISSCAILASGSASKWPSASASAAGRST